jgi:DNA-binding response OmpR family regulator
MHKGEILVVDDDRDIINVLTIILEEEQYRVKKAYTGLEAVTLFQEFQPDLVLLDYMLPDINGDEVAQKIRAFHPEKQVPIILISAAHNAEKIAQTAALDGYIPKPFEMGDLLKRINTLLST